MIYKDYKYFKQSKYNPLTKKQEYEYFTRYKNGESGLITEIMERNIRFVIKMATKYYNQNNMLDIDELISEGMLGLHRAITMFNVESGTPFISYAVHWINNYLRTYAKDSSTSDTVDIELESDTECLINTEKCKQTNVVVEDDNGSEKKETQKNLTLSFLNYLTKPEQYVIYHVFGLGKEEKTLRDISEVLKVSPERVRNIKDRAIRKIKHTLILEDNVDLVYEYL